MDIAFTGQSTDLLRNRVFWVRLFVTSACLGVLITLAVVAGVTPRIRF